MFHGFSVGIHHRDPLLVGGARGEGGGHKDSASPED